VIWEIFWTKKCTVSRAKKRFKVNYDKMLMLKRNTTQRKIKYKSFEKKLSVENFSSTWTKYTQYELNRGQCYKEIYS